MCRQSNGHTETCTISWKPDCGILALGPPTGSLKTPVPQGEENWFYFSKINTSANQFQELPSQKRWETLNLCHTINYWEHLWYREQEFPGLCSELSRLVNFSFVRCEFTAQWLFPPIETLAGILWVWHLLILYWQKHFTVLFALPSIYLEKS